MTLDMKGLCQISSMRLRLWDVDDRYYRYKIEASNSTGWATIVDRTGGTNRCQSWQDIVFSPTIITARYLRLTGTYNSTGAVNSFHVVEWEVYGRPNPLAILTSVDSITVPERSTAKFWVKLNQVPIHSTTVTVSRISGDTNITVLHVCLRSN